MNERLPPSPEGLPFKRGGIVIIEGEKLSLEWVRLLSDNGMDIAKPYRIFFVDGDTVYIGPVETSRESIMAFKPGDTVEEGPVLGVSKDLLYVSSTW